VNGSEGSAEWLFERALATEDEAYLRAETRLRGSAAADEVLEPNLGHEDPLGRLMARVLLEWAEAEDAGFDAALRYLNHVERSFGPTILGTPPVRGVVENLSATFGGRLAEFLALRLVKVPTAPAWRAQVTLAYLERHPTPAVTDALLRYASMTSAPALQAAVARAVTVAHDPALARKAQAEADRLARTGRTLPPAVAKLTG
jgi:hypothetical protein